VSSSDKNLSDDELLELAIKELQGFIEEETTHYAFIEDPRNEDDYDTFEYGTEPLPFDDTWTQPENKDSPVSSFVENEDYYKFAEDSVETEES
jgi:hypothetical protein